MKYEEVKKFLKKKVVIDDDGMVREAKVEGFSLSKKYVKFSRFFMMDKTTWWSKTEDIVDIEEAKIEK